MRLIEAVSLSGLLGDVGMVAGIAAALISAVLAAIVLGQGRELRRLRDELESESDRARQVEASITSELVGLSQAAPVVQAPPVAPAVPLAAPTPASATFAGGSTDDLAVNEASSVSSSAMPALGSATAAPAIAALVEPPRLIHDVVPERVSVETPAAVASPPRPAPVVIPAPVPAAAATAAGVAAGTDPLGAPSTPAAGGISRSPKPPVEVPRRRSIVPRLIGGAVVLAAVIFGVIWFAGSGSDTVERTTATTSAAKPSEGTIVSVLNGTPVSGLAGEVSAELSRDGFKRGRVATARDQQQPKTVVAYMPGHLTDAEAVSQSLKIDAAPVPADDPTQAIACPDPATCNVEVIVTVGADRTR
ncbi:MAG: LytR C-terminal domain-containing protein [Actinomycetes bacterium]